MAAWPARIRRCVPCWPQSKGLADMDSQALNHAHKSNDSGNIICGSLRHGGPNLGPVVGVRVSRRTRDRGSDVPKPATTAGRPLGPRRTAVRAECFPICSVYCETLSVLEHRQRSAQGGARLSCNLNRRAQAPHLEDPPPPICVLRIQPCELETTQQLSLDSLLRVQAAYLVCHVAERIHVIRHDSFPTFC